ncbi:potassium-transporting ATPase subunit KdpB [Brevibacterium sediminis]|uniref:Potassium-transporting ATPase ATP-binding subunit n=1 Tax=Brevibacterium sediminis TaxID=1857024 RepID=A0ABQ1N5G9_9MICO|nr:HAD-IC family P-type ATPase [Brevibacterium sediminis]GGC50731.1 potassium-transporting ATPase ATP-binding subunit [Brevibacterium sediminis]
MRTITAPALLQASLLGLRKLDPRTAWRNPVMFLVEIGAAITLILAIADPSRFTWAISIWLWLTVVFANTAEALAEGRGKAQADSLRASRVSVDATRVLPGGGTETVPASQLQAGDRVLVTAGETIPGDGDVIEGAATVDESAITGESAPVIREAGGDRCAVTGGTKVLSDSITVTVTASPGESFLDRMITMVEGANRQKTPNEVALGVFLSVLTLIFILVVLSLAPIASFSGAPQSLTVLIALLVCLIPTTIGALLSAIGIAGMDRLVAANVLAKSGRAVEAAGDVSTLLLDKTGTITMGDRQATDFVPLGSTTPERIAEAARLSSLADDTPEGRSVVTLAETEFRIDAAGLEAYPEAEFISFSATTRLSGIVLPVREQVTEQDGATSPAEVGAHRSARTRSTVVEVVGRTGAGASSSAAVGLAAGVAPLRRTVVKGAAKEVIAWARDRGAEVPEAATAEVERINTGGGTALLVAEAVGSSARVLGVIDLRDIVKPGMAERFATLREMGIRTVMITGDNELTARAIAREAGVDDFLSEATPEDKLALIKTEQAGGRMVAMTGDGTNDAPALAQADVGVAMNTGTTAAKEAGNLVDLDSDPTKLIDIVAIGKQLLITRGALTTFSIANDVAKYFAIIPAMFLLAFPGLGALNIMGLHSPASAILSAVIFNALIIVALIPVALRGVRFRARTASSLLRMNLLVFGIGGLIVPFIGIKLIDLVIAPLL